MHKIDRDAVSTPTCLVNPNPERRYGHLRGKEREEIREALLEIQKHRCAYCERRTGSDSDAGHIEHFRKQADDPSLDMTWDNMFWSCNEPKTCGKRKDECSYDSGPMKRFDPDDLINPSIDDPDRFFLFVTDGTIRLREGLTDDDKRRASETLRIFMLADSVYLRKSREDAVRPYLNAIDSLTKVATPEVIQQYINSEKPRVKDAPFSAAIRQFFMSYCL